MFSRKKLVQKRPGNAKNVLEMRVVPSAEHNSKATLPNDEESVVVLPQEGEDNSSKCNNELEAEPDQPQEPDQSRGDVASLASRREEVVSIRPSEINVHQPGWRTLSLVVN